MSPSSMLDGRYVDHEIKGYHDELPLFRHLIHVTWGRREGKRLPGQIHSVDLLYERGIRHRFSDRRARGFCAEQPDPQDSLRQASVETERLEREKGGRLL